jgi:hypothetical protein
LVEYALSPENTTAASVNKNYQHSMKWWRAYAVQEDPFAAWEEVLNAPAVSSLAAIGTPRTSHRQAIVSPPDRQLTPMNLGRSGVLRLGKLPRPRGSPQGSARLKS